MSTVSAIIPTYNRAHLLPAALASIFAQTQPVDEVIVVDDGSKDNTADVLRTYGDSVRYIRQQNAGAGAARNHGMREARGDYVAFLDSDDLWMPEKNARQQELLRAHPEIDFLFGDMANFSSENDPIEAEIKDASQHAYFVAHASDLKDLFEWLLIDNPIPTSSVMFRRSCIEQVGYFDQKLRIAQDLEYWLRIALRFRGGFVNAILAKRRRHEGNLINNWAETNSDHAEVLSRVLESNPGISAREKNLIQGKLARLYYDLGSYYLTKRAYAESYSYLRQGAPRHALDWKRYFKLMVSSTMRHRG